MRRSAISWSREAVKDPQLQELLSVLGEHYPIREDGPGLALTARLGGAGLRVVRKGRRVEVIGGTVSLVARGLGMLLSGLINQGREVVEKPPFRTIGLMLDCSRNAVMTVDYLKEWLCRVALMGYNQMMLYTKDTYRFLATASVYL